MYFPAGYKNQSIHTKEQKQQKIKNKHKQNKNKTKDKQTDQQRKRPFPDKHIKAVPKNVFLNS